MCMGVNCTQNTLRSHWESAEVEAKVQDEPRPNGFPKPALQFKGRISTDLASCLVLGGVWPGQGQAQLRAEPREKARVSVWPRLKSQSSCDACLGMGVPPTHLFWGPGAQPG